MRNPVRPEEDVFARDEGLMHEVAVTGRKVGTPSELRAFFARLAHDEQLFREELDRVLGRTGMTEAERLAVEIFGSGKVLGYRDVSRVQKAELPETDPVVPFSEDVLRECAAQNAQGANWRLVYVTGRSLRQEREVMGWDRKKQPCFDPEWTWWLEHAQDPWATQPVEPGYRLFDFTKRFSSLCWQDQTGEVAKLGTNFERAEEQAVTEVCFSNFLLSPNNERLMSNWYHWGRLRSAIGHHVYVGHFDQYGFTAAGTALRTAALASSWLGSSEPCFLEVLSLSIL